ncbi:alpha/beta-hydrolase [Metschnikowia bicuspidata var. bicuspidata NRRL YB-4993]|uniref:Alpha/beta-hydrolase n=1 Tax=Metschnikowia bicuspidata var. bicuspidata NRRL YB-4993 TaxID=869754 RepID=A0A1A0HAI3_9ASCO|nr:alpha/beta-hydrolase [Metschnikowia bicuspidata var. bicuspidata NRRL YB-4993]OBA21021.1 alpha/beta-hydrolase [Metschnikowia bicuspidata var. bicuspidata NRRL YB-4993]
MPLPLHTVLITDKFRSLRDDYRPPKYPIVLCHGLSGFDTMTLLQFPEIRAFPGSKKPEHDLEKVAEEVNPSSSIMVNYWHGIEDALTKAGAKVITAKVPPFGTIADRAALLDALLREKLRDLPTDSADGRVKVNMVGHSMGGLDSRYLISKLQGPESPYRVVSLTTISTPHRGSEVADFVMSYVEKDQILQAMCPKAIPQLTTSFMAGFNETVRDDPSVAYFSYGAQMRPDGLRLFRATYEILKWEITRKGGLRVDNDGMVSVALAKWGKYVGTLDDVDHLDLINWTNRMKATVDQAMFQQPPAFNPIALYLDIADMLSRHGF